MKDINQLSAMRHSCAHLLAAAVIELWPDAKNAIGPAIEDGFYQDFDLGDVKISQDDFSKIEAKMREILATWDDFSISEVPVAEAKRDFAWNPYKSELIEELATQGKTITETKQGAFLDLCKGGHLAHPKDELGFFKLLSVAGAYWRGDQSKKMLTRIYGTCWPTQAELDKYLAMLDEAKLRDHRKLGKELDLFTFSDLVGPGLPLFTPKGTIVRSLLINASEKLQERSGFQKVWIPHITKTDLYKTSGHWDKFGSELFLVKSQETDTEFVMKPMNCPHHTQIYASRPRSYRDLPLRYMETTTCYRDEKTGELAGLSRVRSLNQDDAHIFCTMEQIEAEFEAIMAMIQELYGRLDLKFRARLSFRDPAEPEKYLGDSANWDRAQSIIETIAEKLGLTYEVAIGEAAFYGPKIDIMVTDALGREWQCATEQLDFVQPERFGLTYIDHEGKEQTPVMIHKALLGSVERFLAVYIEHTAGKFPLWLAPVQLKLLPIADRHNDYADSVAGELRTAGYRVEIDRAQETIGKKIRNAQVEKVPYMLVLGDKEVEEKTIAIRSRDQGDVGTEAVNSFIMRLTNEQQHA